MSSVALQIVLGSFIWIFILEQAFVASPKDYYIDRKAIRFGGITTCFLFFVVVVLMLSAVINGAGWIIMKIGLTSENYGLWFYEAITWPYTLSSQLDELWAGLQDTFHSSPVTSGYALSCLAATAWKMTTISGGRFGRWKLASSMLIICILLYLGVTLLYYLATDFIPETFTTTLDRLREGISMRPEPVQE